MKPVKQKKCAWCKELFTPFRTTQKVCSPKCAAEIVKVAREKQERKDLREAKLKVKPRSQWLKEAQIVFNQYIRLRDKHLPCISCGRFHEGQWHAGHFRTVGSSPHLRFDERNVHKQCSTCNHFKSGNIVEYRKNLIKKIGTEELERLESDNEAKHYSVDDIKQIISEYKAKIKLMKGDA